jgi:hypothetical protein
MLSERRSRMICLRAARAWFGLVAVSGVGGGSRSRSVRSDVAGSLPVGRRLCSVWRYGWLHAYTMAPSAPSSSSCSSQQCSMRTSP